MTSPSVKATEALEKPPTAKPLRSMWLLEYDDKPRIDVSYKKVPRQFVPRRKRKSPRYNFVFK